MECFWDNGCTNSSLCKQFGSCIAAEQSKHKEAIVKKNGRGIRWCNANIVNALQIIMESSLDNYTPGMVCIPVEDWKRAINFIG